MPFPELRYTDETGAARTTTAFAGRPLLVNLWATWCAPCLQELAELARHRDELEARGTTVLALNIDALATSGTGVPAASDPDDVLAQAGFQMPHGRAGADSLAVADVVVEFLAEGNGSGIGSGRRDDRTSMEEGLGT